MTKYSIAFLFTFYWGHIFAQQAHLTIRVDVPHTTPELDSIRVIGNQSDWGYWIYPKSKTLEKIDSNTWQAHYKLPLGTAVEFKVTRGSYLTEALYHHNGHSAEAIRFTLTKDTTVLMRPSDWLDTYQRSITGTVRYHHHMSSPLLKNTRNVVVWLPPSYFNNPQRSYPVLYAQDGQNLFDHTNLSGEEWRMDEIADSLMRKQIIEEFIIVGIANTKDRMFEYNGTVEGRNYMTFIAEELKPFMDKTYRTLPQREHTAIIGSSMGGLIACYMAYHYPQIFGKAASLSGGFYFDEGNLSAQLKADSSPLEQSRLYLDCGGKGLDFDFLARNKMLYTVLKQNKAIDLQYREFPEADHNEQAWSARLALPFIFLFPSHHD